MNRGFLLSCFYFAIGINLAKLILAASTSPGFSANYKSNTIGKQVINIANEIQQVNTTSWLQANPVTVVITYPETIYNTEVLVKVILADFQSINLSAGISATLYLLNANKTHMVVNIFSSNAANIRKLTICYLIFYNNAKYFGNVAAYHSTFGVNQTISSNGLSYYRRIINLPTTINMTGGVSVVAILGGIDVYPTDFASATIDITNQLQVTDSSTFVLTISSRSDIPTYVLSVTLVSIIYNKDYMFSNQSKETHLEQGSITLPTSSLFTFKDSTQQITSFNVYLGIRSFGLSNQNSFSFSTAFTEPDSFNITSGTVFDYAIFQYVIIYINYCDYKFPYLYNSLCYDTCPDQTLSNSTSLQCDYLPSASATSPNPFPVWKIVLTTILSVGGVISILLIILFAYKKTLSLKNTKQDRPIVDIPFPNFQGTRKQLSGSPYIDYEIDKSRAQIEPPVHIPLPDQKVKKRSLQIQDPPNYISPQLEVVERNRQQEWIEEKEAQLIHEENCSICWQQQPFLHSSSCKHMFHLTCILIWRKKSSNCPVCVGEMHRMARFYCKVCGKFYKIINLDTVDPKVIGFKAICNQCPI